jgi:hypothetical protein
MTEPIILSNNFEQSLVPHGTDVKKEEEEESEYSSSEEENEADMPPGPVDPAKCTVGGPGTTGGSAQVGTLSLDSYRWHFLWWGGW